MEYIVEKLVHPSAETRGRALESLEFKWKYGLVAATDLLQDRRVLRSLLGLINLGDGIQTTAVALLLLRKIAAADTRLAKALLELGALQQLHAFTVKSQHTAGQVVSSDPTAAAFDAGHHSTAADGLAGAAESPAPKFYITPGVWPDELLPSVEALVSLLLSPSAQSSSSTSALVTGSIAERATSSSSYRQRNTPAAAARMLTSSTSSLQSESQQHGVIYSSPAQPHSLISEQQQQEQQAQDMVAAAAASVPKGPVHPVFGRLQTSARASFSPTAAAGYGSRPGSSGSCAASSKGSAATADKASATSVIVPTTAFCYASNAAADAAAAAGRAAAHEPGNQGAASDVGDTSSFDERLLRARARADWRQQEQGLTTARPEGPGSWPAMTPLASDSFPYGHVTLPVVPLSAADDQALFELNVRLQYSDDERLLLPALLELSGAVGLDMPAEAVLQRQSILDNCLALVSSSRFSKAVHAAAAAVLLQLVNGLKLSLALTQHPELARSEYGDSMQQPAAAGKPGGSSSHSAVVAAAKLRPGYDAAAKVLAAAHAPVLDPTCPNSYPLLSLPESGPDTAWQLPLSVLEQQRVDVTAAVNSICLQVSELLNHPDRHYDLLPILEAALPLLAAPVIALSEGSSSGGVARDRETSSTDNMQQHQQLSEELHALWRGMLGALSRALASTTAVAAGDRAAALTASLSAGQQSAAAGSAVVVLAAAGSSSALGVAGPGLCCWDIQSLHLLQLTLRLLQAAPVSWCCSAFVPPSLTDALAAAASDAALNQLYPHLQQAATPFLRLLRPASLSILQKMNEVKSAAAAAEEAAGPLLVLLEQQPMAAAVRWLRTAQQAVPYIGYNPRTDARLLKCFLHGLAAIAACCTDASSCGGSSSGSHDADYQMTPGHVLLLLLSHQQQQVQQLMLQLLHSATTQGTTTAAVQQLLMLPEVTEHLVVQASSVETDTQQDVSSILLSMLNTLGSKAAAWLMPWRCWIECCHNRSQQQQQPPARASELSETLDAYVQQALQQQQQQGLSDLGDEGFWQSPVVAILQDLFSVSSGTRCAAGRQLLLLMMGKDAADPVEALDGSDEYADDPFKGLLDSHSAGSSSSSSRLHKQQQYFLDPFTDSSANLAANFTFQDATNLLSVLFNVGLAQELRRAAADELLALSPDPQLLDSMVQEDTLDNIWELCVPKWTDDESSATPAVTQSLTKHLPIGAGQPSGDIYDMQLPVAALQLLAAVVARSTAAMHWIRKQPNRLLVPLLPLALHALHSVRRATARLLALVLFGAAADQWTGFNKAAAAAAGTGSSSDLQQQQQRSGPTVLLPAGSNAILLPEPFLRQYKFPFRVLPVAVTAAAAGLDGSNCDDGGTQQQRIIKQLVEQQQLLAAAEDDPAAARQLLQDCLPPTLQHISQHVLCTTANQFFNCDPAAVAQRLLAAVAAARSHAEAEQALRQLERLGSSHRGLQAIASTVTATANTAAAAAEGSVGWESAFERLLGVAPVTAEDQLLWLQLLGLVEKMLSAAALKEVQYTYLQVLLQRSVTAWLQQPAAAKDIPRPPLALASGTNSWQLLRQQPSSAAAAAAVADMLGVTSGSSAEPSAAAAAVDVGASDDGLLAVQVSRQALRVLLQLVSAVKTHCCITSSSSSSVSSCYSLAALQPAALVHLLVSKLIAQGDGVDYCCRALATAIIAEITGALQDVAQYNSLTSNSSGPHQQQQGSASAAGISSSSLSEEAGVLVDSLEPVITKVLMPVAGKQLPGFRGKALVKTSLQLLLVVVEGPLVPVDVWAPVWAAIGGTFWLSRLSRDREASIRCLSLSLLVHLLQPAAAATQMLITANWPDCVNRLVRVAGDVCEAYAVRAAAVRALAAAMVVPVNILQGLQTQQQDAKPQQQQQQQQEGELLAVPAKKLHSFGLAPILQLDQIWCDVIPQLLLTWQQRPAGLVAAAAALAAAGVAAEPDGVGRRLLLLPGLAAAAVEMIRDVAQSWCCKDHSTSATHQVQQQQYMQRLPELKIVQDPSQSTSKLLTSTSGLSAATAGTADASGSTFLTATLAMQQETAALGAAAAAAQLLSLAAAPASSGGGLLLLPAAVQEVLAQVPTVLMQLLSTVGNELITLTNSSSNNRSSDASNESSESAALPSTRRRFACGAMLLLQQQLAAVHVSATTVSTSPLASLPEQQRQQQLLLLITQASDTLQPLEAPSKQCRQLSSSNSNGSSNRRGILSAIAGCLSHTACSKQLQIVLAQLLGLLMADEAVAAAALATSSSSEMDAASDTAVVAVCAECDDTNSTVDAAVGAQLCRELAGLLPASIFTPSTAAAAVDNGTSEAPTIAAPEGLVIIFALQNLLTYSKAAKAAAVEIGLHKLLMEAVQAMAAAVAAGNIDGLQTGSSAAAAAGGGGAAGRSRARWFSYTASSTAATTVTATKRPMAGRGAATAAGSISSAARKAAGPKTVGSLRPSKNRKQQQQQQPQQDDSIAGAVVQEELALPSAAAEPDTAADASVIEDNSAAAAGGGVGGGSKQRSTAAAAATKSVNQRKLMMCVVMLRHLAYGCQNTQAALVGDGLVDVIQRLWPLALNHLPVLLELLLLFRNLLPSCYQARLAAAALGSPQCTVLQSTLALLLPPPPAPQPAGSSSSALAAAAAAAGNTEVVRTAAAVLVGYASSDDGACYLVRAGSSFLNDAQKIMRWCLLSLKKEHERQQQRQVQQQRLVGLLQLLVVVAGRLEGQQAMLRSTVAPALVDLLVDVLLLPQQQGGDAAAAAALLLLRNLAFHADLRSPALANHQLLPLLLAAAECLQPGQQSQGGSNTAVSDNAAVPQWAPLYGKPNTTAAAAAGSSRPGSPVVASAAAAGGGGGGLAVPGASGNVCCAVYAVSALWALMYKGEKIKAAVRKIPRAAARLAAVRDHAQEVLSNGRNADAGQHNSPMRDASRVSDTPEKQRRKLDNTAQAGGGDWQQQKDIQGNGYQGFKPAGSQQKGSVRLVEVNGRSLHVDPVMLSGSDQGMQWWLNQLVDSCTAVLDIMENV